MEFHDLIARARKRDPQAIEELYRRYSPAVLARLRGQLGPALRRRYDTEDLGQSVFAEVLDDLPRFESDHEGAFRKWLRLKAQGKLWTKVRRQLDGAGQRRERTWDGVSIHGGEDDPAQGAAAADDVAKLDRALTDLEPLDRDVVFLRTREGMPYGEIAAILELPSADAVRMRYARAVLRLRELWGKA